MYLYLLLIIIILFKGIRYITKLLLFVIMVVIIVIILGIGGWIIGILDIYIYIYKGGGWSIEIDSIG